MSKKVGFTLIELSLSIAFISMLSLAVVLTIMSTISSYRHGLTLNQVNTGGTDLVDDMMASVQGSPAKLLKDECGVVYASNSSARADCERDEAKKFITVVRRGDVAIGNNDEARNVPLFGAFCTGKYSYIWKSGYLIGGDYSVSNPNLTASSVTLTYKPAGNSSRGVTKTDFKLIKIQDEDRVACRSVVPGDYQDNIGEAFNMGDVRIDEPVELLPLDNNLALYSLDVAKPALGTNNKNMLYSVSFILGTLQGGVNIKASGDNCKTSGSGSSVENFDFCSINKFNFAAQAIGG